MKRLLLLDSNSLIHRAFHALPPLTSPSGEPTGAVYGFTSMLLRALKDLKPDYVAAAFDLPGPTFRHKEYKAYKATRPPVPKELGTQLEKSKEILASLGIPVLAVPGFEADDVLGTLAAGMVREHPKLEIVIVSGDLDTLQLAAERVKIYTTKRGITETILYDRSEVKKRYGFPPELLPDFKALKGDPSDNIPGVTGIGDKTAALLIAKFGAIENLYRLLEEDSRDPALTEAIRKKLAAGKESALLSKSLASIRKDAPISAELPRLAFGALKKSEVAELFRDLGFRTLIQRLDDLTGTSASDNSPPSVPEAPAQNTRTLETENAWEELFDDEPIAVWHEPESPRWNEKPKRIIFLARGAAYEWREGMPFKKFPVKFLDALRHAATSDAKALGHLLRNLGIEPPSPIDISVLGWLLDPERSEHDLAELSYRYVNRPPAPEAPETLALLAAPMTEKLAKLKLDDVWEDIERPLTPILVDMERNGILLDAKRLAELGRELTGRMRTIETEIHSAIGATINLASPAQLREMLFTRLKLPAKGIRRTPKGELSVDSDSLATLRTLHPAIEKIISWRELQKLHTGYVEALPELINKTTGRIHTTFLQTGTATGRLASENPNLQNIPKRGGFGPRLRSAFRADRGYSLVSFDYSQIELRIVAALSGDERMLEAFRKGEDIHSRTAAAVLGKPIENIAPTERFRAKALNFGIIYGMGPQSFAESTGLKRETARQFIRDYFKNFDGVARYIETLKANARERGFAETPSGRKRFLPEIVSETPRIRSQAERVSVNMPIQGAAADLVKIAMIRVADFIAKRGWAEDVKILLQVHDELLLEIRSAILNEAIPAIKAEMERAAGSDFPVPIVVETAQGSSWGELA